MNRNQIVAAALIIALLFLLFKKPAAASSGILPDSQGDADTKPIYDDGIVKIWEVEPYEVQAGDWITKLGYAIVDNGTEAQKLAMSKAIAIINGLDWQHMDSLPTQTPLDPDTIFIGQKLKLPTLWAVNAI